MHSEQGSRFDLGDLKAQIVKKLGADRSKLYFHYLNRLLSQRLSKSGFDKLCVRVLGRENLPLHNQFVRSILNNACQAKTPLFHVSGDSKSVVHASHSPGKEDENGQSGDVFPSQNQSVPMLPNGVLPASPRKGRSAIRDRKLKDRPSSLGLNGRFENVVNQLADVDDGSCKVSINGDVTLLDYQRPVQHLQSVAELPKNEIEGTVQRPAEKPRINSKFHQEAVTLVTLENAEEVDHLNRLRFSRSPLLAPLGIPFCSTRIGSGRKAASSGCIGDFDCYYNSGELSDTNTLRERMEQIATAQGLEGVPIECANMLNNMMDLYLKRLIGSCVELVGARSTYEPKIPFHKQQIQGKAVNGRWPSNHLPMQSGSGTAEVTGEQNPWCSISMLDFKVAMELNPRQLGEDWPLLLEKICMHGFEK